MLWTNVILLPFLVLASGASLNDPEEILQHTGCKWRHNISDPDLITVSQADVLENCLYYYLAQVQGSQFELISEPPWEEPLTVKIDHYVIQQVDLAQRASSQFNIHGDLYISWNDTRLGWNETEWKLKEFALHDNHHIWTPTFNDEASTCSSNDGCISRISEVEIASTGLVSARFTFRFPSFCTIDYYRYPEETNDCCLLLSAIESERKIHYELQTKERMTVEKSVAITVIEQAGGRQGLKNVESSVWSVSDRTIDVIKMDTYRTEIVRLCIHARKTMSTLRIALRIPATIATMLMLVSPLFGDLRIQSFVKLATLFLQTVCFLFTVSLAPVNGFGPNKPKLYTFYECLFFISFLSIMVTLVSLALCRVTRTVPPTHFVFLSAKLINRFFCCIEPESINYQRHLEDGFDSNRGANSAPTVVDYTYEWKQVYVAVNNLFSVLSFLIFTFAIIFELM